MTDDLGDALFEVPEARSAKAGPVLATFRAAVAAGREAGQLVAEDAALIAGVVVLAESLDTAHTLGGMKGGYLAAQPSRRTSGGCTRCGCRSS